MSDKLDVAKHLSVYIHIPFCRKKCAYCDFISFSGKEEQISEYIASLCSEIRDQAAVLPGQFVQTVYIGGGTPSLLPEESISNILSELKASFKIATGTEITLEANPESVTSEKAVKWKHAGINRLSLGVQSFRDNELQLLGRIHNSKTAQNAFLLLRDSGFENINLDLMYGLPGQTLKDWQVSLAIMQTLEPKHLSCYQLILEEGTSLAQLMQQGKLPTIADEDVLIQMDCTTREAVASCGMECYEVSNYAVPGYECRHNLNYWECGSYLGIGCAAHGDRMGRRVFNTYSLAEYLSGNPMAREIPENDNSPEDRRFERMMMGLRMQRGVDLTRFKNDFGDNPDAYWPESIGFMIENQYICIKKNRMALTESGMRVMNALLVRMLEEQDRIKDEK